MHLFSAFQGMAAVAHGANDPEVVVMEVRRLKNWNQHVVRRTTEQQGAEQLTSLSGQKGRRKHEGVA